MLRRWALHDKRLLAGGTAGARKVSEGCTTAHYGPGEVPGAARRSRKVGLSKLRRREKLGPARIAYRLGIAGSTVYRVLRSLGLHRLAWLDRPTGQVIRRYEHAHPGDRVHMDIKKLGRIPAGGGWRVHGRGKVRGHRRVGYAYIHSVVDDHSRLAYSEVLPDEGAETATAFWQRAAAWFGARGVDIKAVLTDNGSAYRSRLFAHSCAALGVHHRRTRPYTPLALTRIDGQGA